MTLIELLNKINKLPLSLETAKVVIKHDLIGSEHEAESIEYDEERQIVYIREVDPDFM